MTAHFELTPTVPATELRLLAEAGAMAVSLWPLTEHPGVDLCQRLVIEELAVAEADTLLVEHSAVATLTALQAATLGLPPATALRAVVEGSGAMLAPSFKATLRWTRPGGQNVLGVERVGAWLREPEGWRRLPETLFVLAEAVAAFQAAADQATRLRALAALREALPSAATAGSADGLGMLGTVTILEADALSLETMGEGDAIQLVPVLHRAGADASPLLPEDAQRAFGAKQFHQWPTARAVYTLATGVYVTLSPPLRQALNVVRQAANGTPTQRRRFLREPRAAIRAAIGDEVDAALLESLVVETPAWSERVIGLGLWEKRTLPWVVISGRSWFDDGPLSNVPPGVSGDKATPTEPAPETLSVDGATATSTLERIEAAIAAGHKTVTIETAAGAVELPATPELVRQFSDFEAAIEREEISPNARLVLLIKPNEQEQDDAERIEQPRSGPPAVVPDAVRTTLKPHQREGLAWLQASWRTGRPGVLLADDMGLGKTLQGLTFLAWLRAGMLRGEIPRAPLLIVAPTGLLENWRAEHDRHLAPPGLGTPLLAYGSGLKALRQAGPAGEASLDTAAIARADWVLTTYETLRDHDRDFGAVRFAAMLLDEAQKVKTPAIRLTDAVKAMNVDFRIALTGTPVENRLADLWCIVDGLAPGYLGDLRRFSRKYETPDVAQEALAELKGSLDRPVGGRPPVLLRRLKEDRLPDLPALESTIRPEPMPPVQRDAYETAIAESRTAERGKILQALQRISAISLHPDAEIADDTAFIAASARLKVTIDILDTIAVQGERALVFLGDLALMARLGGLLQRRYKLAATPMTINGTVDGKRRQAQVDRFQSAPEGFDVMLLSPKAGGVGLTLTRANHVIHLARWWNPAVEDQCNGRAHRIGQMRPVTVHLPLAVAPGRVSFDENLHALLERKRALMRTALVPPAETDRDQAEVFAATIAG